MAEIIIDATNTIVGRLATTVAKRALLGDIIHVINSEKAAVSGNKYMVLDKYKQKKARGIPLKGPYLPKNPDMFVRRIIRGMLPYKQYKGKIAFQRISCHIGVPEEFAAKRIEIIKEAKITKLPNNKYVYIYEICKQLGAAQ